ncbi:hypothetical protein C0U41_29755, partial [Klebsiella pneumoniae]
GRQRWVVNLTLAGRGLALAFFALVGLSLLSQRVLAGDGRQRWVVNLTLAGRGLALAFFALVGLSLLSQRV